MIDRVSAIIASERIVATSKFESWTVGERVVFESTTPIAHRLKGPQPNSGIGIARRGLALKGSIRTSRPTCRFDSEICRPRSPAPLFGEPAAEGQQLLVLRVPLRSGSALVRDNIHSRRRLLAEEVTDGSCTPGVPRSVRVGRACDQT